MKSSGDLDKFLGLQTKEEAEDWDFAAEDTQGLTHGIHPYPARMIPQVARRLVERYSMEGRLVFDPFCGSGTVLVESILLKRNTVGNDINPLAILLTKVKTTALNPHELEQYVGKILTEVRARIERYRARKLNIDHKIEFPNMELWFKQNVIDELCLIREVVFEIDHPDVRDFFKICFSNVVRRTSNIYREGDTFIKRMSPQALKKHNPDSYLEFKNSVIDGSRLMRDFWRVYSSLHPKPSIRIMSEDARHVSLEDSAVNTIITSPPYGEERNTISYTRWSKLSSFWLGYSQNDIVKREKLTLGSGKQGNGISSPVLQSILKQVEKENKQLASEAMSFFLDYKSALTELYRVLKPNGYCCIVLGNRSLKRQRVPTDRVTVDFGQELGFKHVVTYYRNIPTKSIPWTVSKGETIASENIIIMQK